MNKRQPRKRLSENGSILAIAAIGMLSFLLIAGLAIDISHMYVNGSELQNAADAAALGLMAGNAVILRGGSEAVHSNRAIHAAMLAGITASGLPADAVQLVPTQDRAAVGAMLTASGLIDIIIPRGGKSLVARVQDEARVPVLAHLDGICHTYVHAAADADMAERLVVNAKMRRTGICGATETVLIDRAFADPARIVRALLDAGCEVRGDRAIAVQIVGFDEARHV